MGLAIGKAVYYTGENRLYTEVKSLFRDGDVNKETIQGRVVGEGYNNECYGFKLQERDTELGQRPRIYDLEINHTDNSLSAEIVDQRINVGDFVSVQLAEGAQAQPLAGRYLISYEDIKEIKRTESR